MNNRDGAVYTINDVNENGIPKWCIDYGSRITSVVFDPSFAEARPTTIKGWFSGLVDLKQISGMEFLNTSRVMDMSRTFEGCMNLTSLDLKGWNTLNVSNMGAMFIRCNAFKDLDVSTWDTQNVKAMDNMFKDCSNLTTLDLNNFNTRNVTNMSGMFNNCLNLTTIYVGDNWNTDNVTASDNMFKDSWKLVGEQGTTYRPNTKRLG